MIAQPFCPKPRVITQQFYIHPKGGSPRQVSSRVFYQCLAVARAICDHIEYKDYKDPNQFFPCPIYFRSDLFDGLAVTLEDGEFSATTRSLLKTFFRSFF